MSSQRVLRGGSWLGLPVGAGSANRINYVSTDRDSDLGFRLVREPKSYRMLRGGSWGSFPDYSRSAYRVSNVSTFRGSNLGFRLVREQK